MLLGAGHGHCGEEIWPNFLTAFEYLKKKKKKTACKPLTKQNMYKDPLS